MTLWIVLLILAAVLSPLVWLRPSSRQNQQMGLRLAARRMGLAMHLARQEWPHWLPRQPPSPCPQYYRTRRAGRADAWTYWQLEAGQWVDRWREPCADEALRGQLATLPADVYKVEADKQVIAIYWGEQGDAEALQRIASVLDALA
ncbi:hypothetical protein [Zestomonas carbonaria]|uniref:Uncharacterized protein n=1 Tax=Zestomonas carbonaria TaxID=2762745 RepID=A0A7U7EQC8_9GAMM|nr:hypothetical protein [Pseudomonas carbonaria]CAD5108838.1 hypothetical protein PSEWESI4_03130 [Pseudomonas carbonaria]